MRDHAGTSGILLAAALGLFLHPPAEVAAWGGPSRSGLSHQSLTRGFDFSATAFEVGTGLCAATPLPMRILSLGSPELSRDAGIAPPCHPWMVNARGDLGLADRPAGLWFALYAEPDPLASSLHALETSFVDAAREGTPDHRGHYGLVIPWYDSCSTGWDLDRAGDPHGCDSQVVPVLPIPPPRTDGRATTGPEPGYVYGVLDEPLLPFFTHPAVEPWLYPAGYRILYRIGDDPPTSSDPAAWSGEVRDPDDVRQPLGVVAAGASGVRFAVPGGPRVYLANQMVYRAGTPELASRAVSSHTWAFDSVPSYGSNGAILLATSFQPTAVRPRQPVRLRVTATPQVSYGPGVPPGGPYPWAMEVIDQIGLELSPGCLDLATGSNLVCTGCDTVSYDPATGLLRAASATLGTIDITIDFVSGPGPAPGEVCHNLARASASHSPPACAGAVLGHFLRNVARERDSRPIPPGFPGAPTELLPPATGPTLPPAIE